MPRPKRVVIPGRPHHITQRGVRKQRVFFSDEDRAMYLTLLQRYGERYGCLILAYALMTNHVHLLLIPLSKTSLRFTLQFTHQRIADHINSQMGWTGHLWQQKFYSSPVDDEYFWIALRYIERNPVAAGLVKHPAEYQWSSAAAHCGLKHDPILTTSKKWVSKLQERTNWYEWLGDEDCPDKVAILKRSTKADLPSGSEGFLNGIESKYKVRVRPGKPGPRKGRGN